MAKVTSKLQVTMTVESRLELFDAASARQAKRQRGRARGASAERTRGWTRDDLYHR